MGQYISAFISMMCYHPHHGGVSAKDFLLQENLSRLLQEDGSALLIIGY